MPAVFTVTVEGVEQFEQRWLRAFDELERDSRGAASQGAHAGVEKMQADHPYTDRTYNLTQSMAAVDFVPDVETDDGIEHGAEIVVGAEYASFVDRGTSRSRPYPFTPKAERAAEREAMRAERDALRNFRRAVKGG